MELGVRTTTWITFKDVPVYMRLDVDCRERFHRYSIIEIENLKMDVLFCSEVWNVINTPNWSLDLFVI